MAEPHCPESEHFDYVVVGAGTSGCVLAERLSASGRNRVLLLEAGGEATGFWISVPLGIGKLIHDPRFVWPFTTQPQQALDRRTVYWPRGRVIGGSGSVNGSVWVRGDPMEYDKWATSGLDGWSWQDILPVFQRLEHCSADFPSSLRGHAGPIHIEPVRAHAMIGDAFLGACGSLGIAQNADYNAEHYEGASRLQTATRRGRRWSTAISHLRPARGRENLTVRTHATATRVLLDKCRAIGIEYRLRDRRTVAHVDREVILCGGAAHSPQLLELSGIGRPEVLERHGIPVLVALSGVGENFQDHLHVRMTYRAKGVRTVNELARSPLYRWIAGLQYLATASGPLTAPPAVAHAILRSAEDCDQPDLKLQMHAISATDRHARVRNIGVDPFPGFSIALFQLRPHARGSVHISGADPRELPTIDPNFLGDPRDERIVLRGLHWIRDLAGQPELRRITVAETRPGIQANDDAALLGYARKTGTTSYHPVGSCRMGRDEAAVVDAQLRVHQVEGLRVADASVLPTIPSANINAAAAMVGDRCGDFIAAAHGD